MDEHDDDLESEVQQGADQETERYPNTGDDLDPDEDGEADSDEEPDLDEDESEL